MKSRNGRTRTAVLALLVGCSAAPALAQDASDQDIAELIAESAPSPAQAIVLARQQRAAGEPLAAAATLERALLADPNAHEARLAYAATLCSLGDMQGARVELAKLDRHAVSNAGWAEADRDCGGALRRPAPPEGDSAAGFSGEVYAGVAYDSDALGALSLQADFFGEGVKRKDGLALIAGARLAWRAERYESSGGLYASFAAAAKHDIQGPNQDYDTGELRGGYGIGGSTGLSAGAVLRHIRLFGDPYVTEYGGQGEVVFGNATRRRIRLRAEAVVQNYEGRFPGDFGDGTRYDLSAAYEARLFSKGFFTVGAGGEIKTADRRDLGYRGGRVFAFALLPLANRHYASLSGTLRYIDYMDNPPFTDRKDKRAFARAAYGLPLAGRLFLEGAASYTIRDTDLSSTAPFTYPGDLATYRSAGGEARLIWKF